MQKKIILFINLFSIILSLFIVEIILYENANAIYQNKFKAKTKLQASYTTEPSYTYNINDFYSGDSDDISGRKPDGLQYNTTPITIFGCSYTQGQYLAYNQTFSYKLSEILKRPVYNRAVPAKGLAKMYYQSEHETFYKDVPKSDLVIYIMLDDHYRRMKSNYLDTTQIHRHRTYKKLGNDLIFNDYKNPISCFISSTYISKYITGKWIEHYIDNPKNADKLTDEALLYFIKTRKNLEKNWGTKVDFVVIYYNHWLRHGELLRTKLEENGFKVINTNQLTNENLFTDKYFSPQTLHPTEEVWNLLTPKIVDFLGLNKNNPQQ